jgi:hypothetical protein
MRQSRHQRMENMFAREMLGEGHNGIGKLSG